MQPMDYLCKISAQIVIKGNEETDKATKQAIDMPEMTTTRLPHTRSLGELETTRG